MTFNLAALADSESTSAGPMYRRQGGPARRRAMERADAASRDLKPGAERLSAARREVVKGCLPFVLGRCQIDRAVWHERGLTLAMRDKAVEQLIEAGEAELRVNDCGEIVVEAARP